MVQPMNADTQSMYEARLREIMQLPPDQRQQALADLARDYQGRMEDARAQRNFGEEMYAQGAPQGTIAGPGSNPYTAYVAAHPLEHAAAALRTYQGGKERQEARRGLEGLSQGQERATESLMAAMLRRMGVNPAMKNYHRA